MEDGKIPPDSELELPAELRRAMGDLAAPIDVPAQVDRMILSTAHVRLARRQRAVHVFRWGIAAAASIALLFIVRFSLFEKPATAPVALIGDINSDGHVDILDAFTVARAIKQHGELPAAWDVNGDGVVDQKDVGLLAQMAVSVSKGPTR